MDGKSHAVSGGGSLNDFVLNKHNGSFIILVKGAVWRFITMRLYHEA